MQHHQPIIDFHTHILPEMDDGSDSVDLSIKMLKVLIKQEVTHVCATPHYYAWNETVFQFIERRDRALTQLKHILSQEEPDAMPQIRLGAEVAFYSGISQCNDLEKLCLSGTRILLLEMPFSDWNNCQVDEVISLVLEQNYQVVLAHPERFMSGTSYWRYMNKLTELPIALQINASSLLSWRERNKVVKLLQQAQLPLLGSDCHDCGHRAAHLNRAREMIRKKLGSEFLANMDQRAYELIKIR